MPLFFETDSKEQINIKDFISIAKDKIKFNNIDSLLEIKDELLLLANNKSFFVDYLNNQLNENFGKFQVDNNYNEQSYLIFDSENFYIRVTYWPMSTNNSIINEYHNKVFSYNLAHDHNFSLLTAGYKGLGYGTKIWQYDYSKVTGYIGENIDMNYIGETNLSEKKAIFYEPSKDIHFQMPPKNEDSLAINVILKSYEQFNKRQYDFDVDNKKIKNIIYGSAESKFGILKLASIYGDDNTIELLKNISKKHKIAQVRQEAIINLVDLDKNSNHYEIGLSDKDISVKNLCEVLIKKNS